MDQIYGALDRARVIATSVVTIVTAITVALTTLIIPAASDAYGADSQVVTWLAQAVVALTGIVAVVRRVTPVPPEERGVLPSDRGATRLHMLLALTVVLALVATGCSDGWEDLLDTLN